MNVLIGTIGSEHRLKADFEVHGVSVAVDPSMTSEEVVRVLNFASFAVRVEGLKCVEAGVRLMPVFPNFHSLKIPFRVASGQRVEFSGSAVEAVAMEKIWVCLHAGGERM